MKVSQDVRSTSAFTFSFEKDMEGMLRQAGVAVMPGGSDDADMAVRIVVKGYPIYATYSGGRHLATGAELEGVVEFETKAGARVEERFDGKINPPDRILYSSGVSRNGGLFLALGMRYYLAQATLFAKTFGYVPLVNVLAEPSQTYPARPPPFDDIPITEASEAAKAAVVALIDLKDPRAVEQLTGLIDDPKVERCERKWSPMHCDMCPPCRAIAVLGGTGGQIAVNTLVKALALGRLGGAACCDLRVEAAKALGKAGDPSAVEPLCAALRRSFKDSEPDLQFGAAVVSAMTKVRDPQFIEPLAQALKDLERVSAKVSKTSEPRTLARMRYVTRFRTQIEEAIVILSSRQGQAGAPDSPSRD